ncbi:MAG: hypothetical protein CM1200mP2_23960 [Planctomycetaceae bacterium]|nr:MAG: hypothetical protein CM1200mP2_23960 [Planctomycetaceae bacterium]
MSNMSRAYSLMGALILAVLAVILLRQPREARTRNGNPTSPAAIRLGHPYTRTGCHLCHQALDTLLLHSNSSRQSRKLTSTLIRNWSSVSASRFRWWY